LEEIMNMLRAFGSFVVVGLALSATACSSGTSGSSAAEEKIGEVDDAIATPTGTLDATTAPKVFVGFDAQTDFNGMSDVFAGIGATGSIDAKCVSGATDTSGTVDVSCSSNGAATGSISYDIAASVGLSGVGAYVTMNLSNVCKAGVCMTGTIYTGTTTGTGGNKATTAAEVDITKDSAKKHVHFGVQTATGLGASSADIAIWDDAGKTYAIHVSTSSAGAEVSIEAANGKFSCSSEGGTGSCTGSASFTWGG
jgi:hypothetical protein